MVCHKKLLEIRNLLPEHSTGVGVTYQLSAVGMADDDTVGVDINLTLNCCFGGFERLQGRKDQTVGVIGQRVSGNTGLFLVGLGKAAVDDQNFAAAFDRTLAIFGTDRNMTVDDVASGFRKTELRKDMVDYGFVLQIAVVWILFFCVVFLFQPGSSART